MEERNNAVSFVAFESMKTTMERTIRRLWVLVIILVVLLCATNAAWIYYESSFEDTIVTQDVDTGTGNATVTGIGDIYGESKTDSQETDS